MKAALKNVNSPLSHCVWDIAQSRQISISVLFSCVCFLKVAQSYVYNKMLPQ